MLAGTRPLTLVVLLDHSLYFKLEKPVFCELILLFLKLIIYITVCMARCVKVSSFGSLSHFTKINKVCGLIQVSQNKEIIIIYRKENHQLLQM